MEKTFAGAHADVGGGYDNDYLSRVPLQWMWNEMAAAGIQMDRLAAAMGDVPAGVTPVAHESHRNVLYLNDWRRVTKARNRGATPGRTSYFPACQ